MKQLLCARRNAIRQIAHLGEKGVKNIKIKYWILIIFFSFLVGVYDQRLLFEDVAL